MCEGGAHLSRRPAIVLKTGAGDTATSMMRSVQVTYQKHPGAKPYQDFRKMFDQMEVSSYDQG